ncbi:MAG TPA: 6,7-dimethyl-8-ribityllumazine synthase, partial [Cytophagaceae bacterium]
MATALKNLSSYSETNIVDIKSKKFALVVAEWNSEITEALYSGAVSTLLKHGALKENIIRKTVPGSFELSLG